MIGRIRIVRQALKVERQPAVERISAQEAHDLVLQRSALVVILKHRTNAIVPGLRVRVEVVEVGKDFRSHGWRQNDAFHLVQAVRVVDGIAVNDGILAQIIVAHGHQRATGRVDVQPLRKKHVNLVNVLLERGVTGGVILHVIGGAQALTGVQGNVGRASIGFAPGRDLGFVQHHAVVGQGAEIVAWNRQQ